MTGWIGILGLHNLVYFAENHKSEALNVLKDSKHPRYWYGFATAGINLTAKLLELMNLYTLNFLFYDKSQPLDVFNDLYVKTFIAFNKFWMKEKATVMQFNEKKNEFFKKLKNYAMISGNIDPFFKLND